MEPNKREKMKRHKVLNGEPTTYKYGMAYWSFCCDCKLAHLVFFEKNKKGELVYMAYRDDWETQKAREKMSDEELDGLIRILQAEKRRRKKLKEVRSGKNI